MGTEANQSCIDIDIITDMDFEGDHSFEVTLGLNMPMLRGGTGGFGSPTSTTITIQDCEGMFGYNVLCNFALVWNIGFKECYCIVLLCHPRQLPGIKLRIPGLCSQCSATELRQPNNHQPSQSSMCITSSTIFTYRIQHLALYFYTTTNH